MVNCLFGLVGVLGVPVRNNPSHTGTAESKPPGPKPTSLINYLKGGRIPLHLFSCEVANGQPVILKAPGEA